MKKIISLALGLTFATTLVGTVFASYTYTTYNSTYCMDDAYVCPNGTTVGRTGTNCQFVCPITPAYTSQTINNSYTYTSGCYTYYYNGVTRNSTIISYNCSNTYSNNYTYTYPTQTYYYTAPTSYVSPHSTYCYKNGTWYPASNSKCNDYHNNFTLSNYGGGYTDTGYGNNYYGNSNYYGNNNYGNSYGNSNYYYGSYGDGFMYRPTNPCSYQSGYQVCY